METFLSVTKGSAIFFATALLITVCFVSYFLLEDYFRSRGSKNKLRKKAMPEYTEPSLDGADLQELSQDRYELIVTEKVLHNYTVGKHFRYCGQLLIVDRIWKANGIIGVVLGEVDQWP